MQGLTRRQSLGAAVVVLAAVIAALVLSPTAVLRRATALTADPVVFLGVLAALYLFRPLFAFPVVSLSILVGYVYGLDGMPIALVGAVGTCLPPFLIARYVRPESGWFARLGERGDQFVDRAGAFRGVAASRLVPLPADVMSYAAGFSGVSLRSYVAGTTIGMVPWVIAGVLAGESMHRLAASGTEMGPTVVVGVLALAVLLFAGPVYRHFRNRGDPV